MKEILESLSTAAQRIPISVVEKWCSRAVVVQLLVLAALFLLSR